MRKLLTLTLLASCAHWSWDSDSFGPDTQITQSEFDQLISECNQTPPSIPNCNIAGVILITGNHGIAPNPNQAIELFETACEAGYRKACSNLRLARNQENKELPAL